jgi:hypothetical protein
MQDAERDRKAKQKLRGMTHFLRLNDNYFTDFPQSGFLSRDKDKGKEAEKPKIVKSSIPSHVNPEEDGDGRSSEKPILIPSGIEELDDDE